MNFLKGIFCDKNGIPSSKRVMTFIAFCAFIQAVEMNLFRQKVIDSSLLTFLITMIGGGMGLSTFESVVMKKDSVQNTPTT
jgi:hypothetical protein